MIKQFAVIGLGRFGNSVARTLTALGHEVLALDVAEDNVNEALANQHATQAMCLDTTNIHGLEELGLTNFDAVILAIGANLQESILTALNLIELGVKNVVAKANGAEHGKILERLGVRRVIYPEREMGERVAKNLVQASILESIELDPRYSIIEIKPPDHLIGKTLAEADLRSRYGIYVIAVKHGDEVDIVPDPTKRIYNEDILVVIGETRQLKRIV
ncbi:MAG: TrkA family potassium uptake protein [Nevskia sp.]|nr:TrkA family potassium uptake protein [Nevskia sp.]